MSIYAAYLYDSVKLYGWALDELLRQEQRPLTDDVIHEVASNGTKIIETIIKNRTYKSEYFSLLFSSSRSSLQSTYIFLYFAP